MAPMTPAPDPTPAQELELLSGEHRYLRGLVRKAREAPLRVSFVEVNVEVLHRANTELTTLRARLASVEQERDRLRDERDGWLAVRTVEARADALTSRLSALREGLERLEQEMRQRAVTLARDPQDAVVAPAFTECADEVSALLAASAQEGR